MDTMTVNGRKRAFWLRSLLGIVAFMSIIGLPSLPSLADTEAASASSAKIHHARNHHKRAKYVSPLFEMFDFDGRRVTEATWHGKPILIVFGYTFCPDACPTGLQNLSRMLDLMGEDSSKVQALFITLDPQRDTPEKLKEYLANFHPSILGLRGTEPQTAAAAKALRVTYAKAESVGNLDYEMDYSSVLTIIGPDGHIVDSVQDDIQPEALLQATQKHMLKK